MSFAYGSAVAAVLPAAGEPAAGEPAAVEPAAVEPAAVVVLAAVGPAAVVEAEDLVVVDEAAHHQDGAFVVVAGSLQNDK